MSHGPVLFNQQLKINKCVNNQETSMGIHACQACFVDAHATDGRGLVTYDI